MGLFAVLVELTGIFAVSDVRCQPHKHLVFTRTLMGTDVKIVLYAEDSLRAGNVAELAFGRIAELNEYLSDYLVGSELSKLSNTYGQPVRVTTDLWDVLSTAHEISRESGGVFDVTIGPVTRLWRHAIRRGVLPDAIALSEAKEKIGYVFIQLNPENRTVQLNQKKMRLDLGGIAKGYAADQALEVLTKSGYISAVVDAGGDIALGDAPPDADGWEIEVFSMDSRGNKIILNNCGIAVSGDTFKYVEHRGIRYSHIVDPQTGYGVTHQRKVAVIAPNAMIADAWASTYSVMGWESITLNLQEQGNLSVRILEAFGKDYRELSTGKFRKKPIINR